MVAGLLAGCSGAHEAQWSARTGSPDRRPQAVAYRPQPGRLPPGDPNEKQVRGCLSGANEQFRLVEERSATVYRLEAPEGHEAEPNARQVFEQLKLNAGRVVEVKGERRRAEQAAGAPYFEVREVSEVAPVCPANLMGATSELNLPPLNKVGIKQVAPRESLRGSMRQTPPATTAMPVNPAR